MAIMRDNPVKAKLNAGEPVLGCWSQMMSPVAAEVVALAGYDFVMIDNEHAAGSLQNSISIMQAVAGHGVGTMMRLPWNDFVYTKRALDAGVEGVLVPWVNTVEEAREAVAACHYPPVGVRGAAYTVTRCSDYGMRAKDYAAHVADNLVVMTQVETKLAVDNLSEISAVDGIDVLFIGPFDLSVSMGKAGQFDDPEVADTLDRAERTIVASGKVLASIVKPGDSVAAMIDRGYKMIVSGSDIAHVRNGALADVAAFRER